MSVTLKQLLEAGCHFGHQSRRWNPKMMPYLFTERDGVHVFDLVKTKDGIDRAATYVTDVVARGGKVLFVGSKRQAGVIVRETAKSVGMPYVCERWLGGTFTNFGEIRKRVTRLNDLVTKRDSGELKGYTKKEQLLISREIDKLERFFGGIVGLDKLPEAIFVVDTHREDTAVREARRVGVKVIGIVDSNSDPESVDYVIPANDDAVKSINIIVGEIGGAVARGQGGGGKEEVVIEAIETVEVKKGRKKKVVKAIDEVVAEPEEV